jgi:hypothetical protein
MPRAKPPIRAGIGEKEGDIENMVFAAIAQTSRCGWYLNPGRPAPVMPAAVDAPRSLRVGDAVTSGHDRTPKRVSARSVPLGSQYMPRIIRVPVPGGSVGPPSRSRTVTVAARGNTVGGHRQSSICSHGGRQFKLCKECGQSFATMALQAELDCEELY